MSDWWTTPGPAGQPPADANPAPPPLPRPGAPAPDPGPQQASIPYRPTPGSSRSMASGRRWPSASDYMTALQTHGTALLDPELARGNVAEGLFGLPAVATGQTAAVFRIDAGSTAWAVRCLTMEGSHRPDRYAALARRIAERPSPYFVHAEWQEAGVRTNGDYWPIVKMEWAAGATLNAWVADHLDDPTLLRRMCSKFGVMLDDLWNAGIAHGDLQHGNVVVRGDGQLVLVDYDGIVLFAPDDPRSIVVDLPDESGHPNYQHPHRVETGAASAWVDTFSGLVITTSLEAIAARPELWPEYHNDENLLFTASDLERPGATSLWRDMQAIPDVAERVALLERFCRRDSCLEATLAQLVDGAVTADGAPWTRATAAIGAPTSTTAVATWEQTPSPQTGPRPLYSQYAAAQRSSTQPMAKPKGFSGSDAAWLFVIIAAVVMIIVAIVVLGQRP